jgi:DNA-binding NtrC family response regulator
MKKSSILIVDDEESIRVSLEGFLKKNITFKLLKVVQ